MEPTLTGLGVGGVVLILALKEIRAILAERAGRKNGNGTVGTSGSKSPEFWQAEFRSAMTESFVNTALPVLTQQTKILEEIRDEQRRLSDEMLKMVARQSVRGRKGNGR